MYQENENRFKDLDLGQWFFKKAAPGSHVCGKEIGANAVEYFHIERTNNGKQDDDGNGKHNGANRIIAEAGQADG